MSNSVLRNSRKTMKVAFNNSLSGVLLALLFIAVGYSVLLSRHTRAQTSSNQTSNSTRTPRVRAPRLQKHEDMAHMLAASYYSIKEGLSASLMLSNQGPHPMEIRVVLFGVDGQRLDLPPQTLEPTTVRSYDMGQWARLGGPSFQEGSLRVLYNGMSMELGGAVRMINARKSLILDEELSEPGMDFASTRLEGVWWLPSRKAELRLVLSNVTNSLLTTRVNVEQSGTKVLTLGPHETRMINLSHHEGDFYDVTPGKFGGISIKHTGNLGALLARGLVTDASIGYSQVVEFKDPGLAKSSSLNGAGLRLGKLNGKDLHPIALGRNTGNASTLVTGRIRYTMADGTMGSAEFTPTNLAPGETRVIDLESAAKSVRSLQDSTAGVEFEYTTSPGTVIISAQSISTDDNQVYRVSVIDAQAQMSSTGKYPWSLSGGASTVIYIKNVTDEQQSYYLYANYNGGFWVQGVKTIEPHKTVALDMRQVKEKQIKDEKGQTLPENAMEGQVFWSGAGTKNLVLIGRVEQVEAGGGMSFTTACGTCCFPHFSYGRITPENESVEVGDSTQFQFHAKEQSNDCYGVPYASETNAGGQVVWSSSDPSVASISSSGVATTHTPGSTIISAHWQANNWEYVDHTPCDPETGACGGFQGGGQPMGTCDYLPILAEPGTLYSAYKVEISNAQTVNDGESGSFSITVTGTGGVTATAYAWSYTAPSGAGNNPNVAFTASTAQSTNTDAHWFAKPNEMCGAALHATYTIKCHVSLSNGKTKDKETQLTVSAFDGEPGHTTGASVIHGPVIAFNPPSGLWVVDNQGQMTRTAATATVNIPAGSQFYDKAVAHENQHVANYATGGVLGDLWTVASLYSLFAPLTGTSQQDLINKLGDTTVSWDANQTSIFNSRHRADEQAAYAASDPVGPQYLGMWQCQQANIH